MRRSLLHLLMVFHFLENPASAQPSLVVTLGKTGESFLAMDQQKQLLENLPQSVQVLYFYNRVEESIINRFKASLRLGPHSANVRLVPLTHTMTWTWTRDYSPEMVQTKSGSWKLVAFSNYAKEYSTQITNELANVLGIPWEKSSLVLEGGNVIQDGHRAAFLTELTLRQNPHWNREKIVDELKRLLEVDRIQIFPTLPGEHTGHVDTYLLNMGGNRMMVSDSSRKDQKAVLDQVAAKLSRQGYKITRLMMGPSHHKNSTPSYTNALKIGHQLYLPVYGNQEFDAAAEKAYSKLGLLVTPIQSRALSEFAGEIHCLTHEYQVPALLPKRERQKTPVKR